MEKRAAVAIYARISQDRDNTGMAVSRQLADCRAEVKRRGWKVAEEYVDEDISASSFSSKVRPAYQRMLTDISDGIRDAVVVWHVDRLHRKPIELELFAQTCSSAGLTDVVTLHGDLNLGNGDGLLVARLLAAVAASESDSKSRRSQRKSLATAEAGLPHFGGSRPFGFEDDRVTHNKVEARAIRESVARILAGESLNSMTKWLAEKNVFTVEGKVWRTPSLRQMLLTPRLYGMRVHQGQVIGEAVWKPIISAEDGERLRILLTDPSRRTNRTARRYLLSGLCRCANCGSVMFSQPRNETRRYVCRSGLDFGGCGSMSVIAPPLEDLVQQTVLIRLDSPALTKALDKASGDENESLELSELIRVDAEQLEELSGLYADRAITAAEWKNARAKIDARLVSNRRALSNLRGNRELNALVGQGQILTKKWQDLNLTRQVAIVKTLVDHVRVHTPTVRGRRDFDLDRVEIIWRL